MKCILLDRESLDIGDIDLSPIERHCAEFISYPFTPVEIIMERLESAEIAITNKVVITAETLQHLPRLKLICVAATGYNNVNIKAAKENGVAVCNVTGYATSSVTQHVFTLILSLVRSLPDYLQDVQMHQWQQSRQFCLLGHPIIDLADKTLGIIGYGELGRAVAKVGEAFGMKVLIAESLTGKKSPGRVPLDILLQTADVVSLHCPLSEESRNLINQKTLRLMKKSAFLINAARGGIVNEDDLWQALIHKEIAGAAVDVLSQEPPVKNKLIDKPLPNLIVTPHIAWASQNSRQKLIDEVGLNIQSFLDGEMRNRLC